MLNVAREATSSNQRSPDYILGKYVAKINYLSSIMGVLLSPPVVYGFVNTRWVHGTDFILRKKPGRNKIHIIRIISKMSAEINTTMKHDSKLTAQNYGK